MAQTAKGFSEYMDKVQREWDIEDEYQRIKGIGPYAIRYGTPPYDHAAYLEAKRIVDERRGIVGSPVSDTR